MKAPDKNTLTIWYSLVTFGLVTSFALSKFAGVRFGISVWMTVPSFLVVGLISLRWWMRTIDHSIAKATTPLQVRHVPGIGTLSQFSDHWAVEIGVLDVKGTLTKATVTIAADSSGPSQRQLDLIRTLREKYPQLIPMLRARLREQLDLNEVKKVIDVADFTTPTFDINPDEIGRAHV